MRMALALAARALGDTSPNPVVGAVVVKGTRVVGTGFHRRAGLPHAEVEALRRAGSRAKGGTLYVTLEPCNHTGRTPPCCDAILRSGVHRVVIGMRDPNPITNGRGLARLRRAGLRVTTGVLEADARELNEPFTKTMTTRLPWVTVKIAQSLDGKIATRTGDSKWISSSVARILTHQWRRDMDAVVVGVNTVLRDDPRLTARDPSRPFRTGRPIRVIVDTHLRTPLSSRCLQGARATPTVIATTERSPRKRAKFERVGVRVLVLPPVPRGVPMRRLFKELVKRYQITSALIEGGGELVASALQERVVDRLRWFIAPLVIGGQSAPSSVGGTGIPRLAKAITLRDLTVRRVGPDLLVEAAVVYPRR